MSPVVPRPRQAEVATDSAREASLAAWDAVLDAVDVDLDDAERLLAFATPVAGEPDARATGAAGDRASADARATAAREALAVRVHLPDRLPTEGLTRVDVDDIVARLRRLDARHRAVIPLLEAAMAANRRHRELLDRASAPTDRPVFVDHRA